MYDIEELREMSTEERRQLKHALAEIDDIHPLDNPRLQRRRHLGLAFATVACVFLIAWIGYLAVSLPRNHEATAWRFAWAGFDVLLLAGLTATAWASWKKRQIMIGFATATAALLICDAWFDLTLSWGTHDFGASVVTALCGELPTAAALLTAVHRIAKTSQVVAYIRSGSDGPLPPLYKIPLFVTD